MEIVNLVFAALVVLAVTIPVIHSEKDHTTDTAKPPPGFNPLEDLILNQSTNGFKPGSSLTRQKRQYIYEYPYPIPIIIGGGFGGFGGFGGGYGRGFGGRGFGGRGFGGRGFGGRGFGGRGFGGRGIGGRGFGGRGGGFGGGRGGRG